MSVNSTNENANCFRGKCEELKDINNVGFDVSRLVQESPSTFEGEPPRRFLPVRAQLAWFRKMNPRGRVLSEIIQQTEFVAVAKATIEEEGGVIVSVAHGSADATNDGVYGFKLVESAESRAIARALDFAGYGCQLDLKTVGDESGEPAPAAPSAPAASEVKFPNEAQDGQDAPPAPIPGTIKGTKKVDANAASGIVDVSALKGAAPAELQTPSKAKANKKNSGGEQAPAVPAPAAVPEGGAAKDEPAPAPTPVEASAAEPAAPVTPAEAVTAESPASEPDPSAMQDAAADVPVTNEAPATGEASVPEAPVTETEPPAAESAAQAETDEAPAPGATPENEPAAHDGNITPELADKLVRRAVAEAIAAGKPPELDADYFSPDEVAGEMALNKSGKVTGMGSKELQLAAKHLAGNPGLARALVYPSNKGTFVGLTFAEVLGMEQGKVAIESCVRLYQKDNYPAYAAALILNKESDAGSK